MKLARLGSGLFASLALLVSGSAAFAQSNIESVRLTLISGSGQHVVVDNPLAQPFVMRATDTTGAPVAGLAVAFEVNSCNPYLLEITCPPTSLYGSFGGSIDASAITDASGIATSPLFIAGSTAGTYSTFGYSGPQFVGSTYYLLDSYTGMPLFDITQINAGDGGGGPVAIAAPDLGLGAKLLAGLLLMFSALWHLRRNGVFTR